MPGSTADSGPRLGHWSSPRAAQAYAALSAEVWASARQGLEEAGLPPVIEADVATPYGVTHAHHWPGEGTPIVLLHGAGTSSLMWAFLVAHLGGLDIHAVDTVGDPGRSMQTAALADADDLAGWLGAALDGLRLDRVHLVGASYGGYVGVVSALRSPARVRSLALVEPVLDPLRLMFWINGLATMLALAAPGPVGRWGLRRAHMDVLIDQDPGARRMAILGQTRWRRTGLPGPVPVTDDELASLTVPTLLLLGEHSAIHRSRALLERARAHVPDLTGEVIAGTGHPLPVHRPDEVARLLRPFLAGVENRSSPAPER
jgi:pimeloyl-ACP methyl ester carboxylesterase